MVNLSLVEVKVMSEEVQELENDVEVNPVAELIDQITAQDFNKAQTSFSDILADRMQSALDAEKAAVASDIYNTIEDDADDEDDDDIDLEDVDLDDEFEEEEDDK
jgi:hypothetical protein